MSLHFSSYVCNLSHPPGAALPPESGNQTPSSCKPDGAHEDGPFRGQDGHASLGFATRQAQTTGWDFFQRPSWFLTEASNSIDSINSVDAAARPSGQQRRNTLGNKLTLRLAFLQPTSNRRARQQETFQNPKG